MAAHGYEEDLLRRWFPSVEIDSPNRKAFTERDIREISDILERAKKTSWSRIPRIYIILRLIGKLEAIESFINQDISDTGFPFTQNTLPGVLRDHSDRSQFLSIQKLICNTRALNLERPGIGHGHFPDPSEIPLKKIGDLGKGGSGIVERVISTVSHQEYALKLIRRGTTFRKDKEVLYNYEKELSSLKKLSQSHCHIIDLIGSYTDPKYVGILFPVADCNLAELLDNPIFTNRRGSLRPYFGCLISALAYLHENKIRHKDIKPQNILVKNGDPYFTDFGLSVDWSELSHGTTTGPTAMTPKYGAPEVAACEPRNFSSDIWSLGCVYLEIWNVLKDGSRDAIAAHFTRDGRALPYHSEAVDMRQCLEFIQRIPGPDSDNSPRAWIQHMLERRRDERWSANLIMDSIKELSMDHYSQYLYIGRCCLDDDDSAESVISQSGEASTRDSEAENITSNSRKPSERDRRPYQNRSSYHGPEDLHKNPLPFVKDYYPKINTNGSFTPSHGSTHQPSPGFNDSTTRLQTASDHGSKGGPSFGGHVVSQGPKVEHHNLSYPPGVRLDDYMGIKAVAFSKELLHPYGILRAGHQYKSTWTEWFVFGWMSPFDCRQLIQDCAGLLSTTPSAHSGGIQGQPDPQQRDQPSFSAYSVPMSPSLQNTSPYTSYTSSETPGRSSNPHHTPTSHWGTKNAGPSTPATSAYAPYNSPDELLATYAKKYSLPSNPPTQQSNLNTTNPSYMVDPNQDPLAFLQARANFFKAHDPFKGTLQ